MWTVSELIETLSTLKPDAMVLVCTACDESILPLAGVLTANPKETDVVVLEGGRS